MAPNALEMVMTSEEEAEIATGYVRSYDVPVFKEQGPLCCQRCDSPAFSGQAFQDLGHVAAEPRLAAVTAYTWASWWLQMLLCWSPAQLRPFGLAVLLLMAAGACYAAGGLQDPRITYPGPPAVAAAAPMPLHITPLGLLLLILYCLISGLSSVYTEMLMKRQRLPLALQNLFLYTFSVLLNLGLHAGSGPGPGLLEGFSGWAALMVLSQALNGLLMSAVMKHGSSITRLFVVSCSLVVNAVLSAALLQLQLTAAFFLATLLIGLAVRLYYGR
ncbi:PREDICTED: probable UDP-sugar transporter protein SLC35A4-like [Elephantulus edwardii]|uniref:probable UDP-sugar transporter protein SLC35A4-like n=1 Tax=Elephantulus edwardii TaxID=28737 RepID=UPI0003F0A536|nr:PREDICTED: probable UDP-sugar transporter protein SLC35A4-like [Elephantulus edwardii]